MFVERKFQILNKIALKHLTQFSKEKDNICWNENLNFYNQELFNLIFFTGDEVIPSILIYEKNSQKQNSKNFNVVIKRY